MENSIRCVVIQSICEWYSVIWFRWKCYTSAFDLLLLLFHLSWLIKSIMGCCSRYSVHVILGGWHSYYRSFIVPFDLKTFTCATLLRPFDLNIFFFSWDGLPYMKWNAQFGAFSEIKIEIQSFENWFRLNVNSNHSRNWIYNYLTQRYFTMFRNIMVYSLHTQLFIQF